MIRRRARVADWFGEICRFAMLLLGDLSASARACPVDGGQVWRAMAVQAGAHLGRHRHKHGHGHGRADDDGATGRLSGQAGSTGTTVRAQQQQQQQRTAGRAATESTQVRSAGPGG